MKKEKNKKYSRWTISYLQYALLHPEGREKATAVILFPSPINRLTSEPMLVSVPKPD